MARIGVIGAGSWGIALSLVLFDNGHEVTVWSALEDEVSMLNSLHEHRDKLPGVRIPEAIAFTSDIGEVCRDAELLVLAVPSPYTRSTAHLMSEKVKNGQIIVSVAKGVEEKTLDTLSDIIKEEIPFSTVAVMSGPSHAEEVGRKLPTTCVVGAKERKTAEYIQDIFMNGYFRVYTSPDVLGIELGGALKNVVALAAGMADGLGYGDNTKAALITRG
ncbi:MAG TPA: glycerol-3-phosphate dehydrogenase, partial [Lachnospiraceae bacterium]|nr:glycerol-3-phosphate dehydrogenase [Lachnospiraceae bacterium]